MIRLSCNIIASGGMKCIEDIKKLKKMNIYGAIIGKALYSGNISLEEAIYEGRGVQCLLRESFPVWM